MPESLASRSGSSDPHGKLDQQMSLSMSTETLEALTALAVLAAMPRGEFTRRLIERAVFGELSVMRQQYGRGAPAGMVRIHPEQHGN